MNRNLTNEIFLRIVAIILSVLVWFIIIYMKNPVIEITVKNIPVTFSGEDILEERGLCAVRPEKPLTSSVSLSGTRNDLFGVIDKVSANIDLSGITATGSTDMNINFYQPSNSVDISKKGSSYFTITIDKTVEKDVPVVIHHNGSNKTYLVSSSATPQTIHIKGAESEISRIEAADAFIDISTLDSDKNETVKYSFTDDLGNEIEQSGLCNVYPDFDLISVSSRLYRKKVADIEIAYPPVLTDKYDIQTKNVSPSESVVGISADKYESFKSIRLEAPENLTPGQNQKFTLPLPETEGVYFESDSNVLVIADIEEKYELQKTVPIEFQGISKERITVPSQTVTLNLITTEKRLADSQITATVNLAGYTSGEYKNVPITITAPEQITVRGLYKTDLTIN